MKPQLKCGFKFNTCHHLYFSREDWMVFHSSNALALQKERSKQYLVTK